MKATNLPDALARMHSGKIPVPKLLNKQIKNYFISFKHYRNDLCEIEHLEKNRSKECVHVLKRASQSELGKLDENNVDRIPIRKSGEYKKLYNQLDDDIEIFEHKIQGTSRLFYFLAGHEFHVIAITNNHYETDKVR